MSQLIQSVETESEQVLESYVQRVRGLVDADGPVEELVASISDANACFYEPDFRMPEDYRVVRDDVPYTRNLVYQDPGNRFSVICICWGPFQETKVHDHLNWGAVAVLEGIVHEIDYDRVDDESDPWKAQLEIRETTLHRPGDCRGITPPPRSNIHKMANGTGDVTVSLHTYGDPGTKARVFDPASGKVEVLDLKFHNT